MVKQSFSYMHGRGWKLRRPVKLRFVPLGEFLLLLVLRVVTLMWQMIIIKTNLIEHRSLFALPINLFGLRALQVCLEPALELIF